MTDVVTLCLLYYRLNGSGEVFDLSSRSDSLSSENITYQDSQKANQLIHFYNRKQFQICDLSGSVVPCVVHLPPAPVVEYLGAVWPPALTPKTHTSCLCRFRLSTLSFLVCYSAGCSALLRFLSKQTAVVSFSFLQFLKRNFPCSWCKHGLCVCVCVCACVCERERESSEPQTTHNMLN